MVRLGALIHVMAGLVFSGIFVLVLIYWLPWRTAPIGLFIAAAVLGWMVSIPFSWWVAKRVTGPREEARLKEEDRAEFIEGRDPKRPAG